MSLVPIIIPYFREQEKLKKCLAAIQAQSHSKHEVFVRDNTHDNIYFTAAVNEGLAKYCYRDDVEYVLVLNQDAYLQKDCLARLIEFMAGRPDCGIACPLQVAEADTKISWSGAGAALKLHAPNRRVTWGGSLQAFPFGVHECRDFASYREPAETYWANGACMLIRTAAVREVGVFDRNMRFICSDSDFSFTARARGWKIFVVPAAVTEHSLGSSRGSANAEIELIKRKDALYFARKWLSGDVYRELAQEGPQLTRGAVKHEVDKLARFIAVTEGRLPASLNYFRRMPP